MNCLQWGVLPIEFFVINMRLRCRSASLSTVGITLVALGYMRYGQDAHQVSPLLTLVFHLPMLIDGGRYPRQPLTVRG